MTNSKSHPFSKSQLDNIIKAHPTPFHIYDKKPMLENAQSFNKAFSWAKGYTNYFAVKGTPTPAIVKALKDGAGYGADCSSLTELLLVEKIGLKGEEIMFTSNNTTAQEYEKAYELGAIINLDDISHIEFLEETLGGKLPEMLSFRYNPGEAKAGNTIIGHPADAKYGLTTDQMYQAYEIAKNKGVKRFGIHTMVASNELNEVYFAETANIMFKLAKDIQEKVGIKFDLINLGGGIGVAYHPDQTQPSFAKIGELIKEEYNAIFTDENNKPRVVTECARCVTAPFGYLVTKAVHHKDIYKKYIGVDACMTNLMRPALYGAYHHISVIGKENAPCDHTYDLVGKLCENNDKFAIDRKLPKIDRNDLIVIHDTGAHGHAMGFNYNGTLKSAEIMLNEDGSFDLIRRQETIEDLFQTLVW